MANTDYSIAEASLEVGLYQRAQAEATLALAHEQRTANLIALLNSPKVNYRGQALDAIINIINDRLGIEVTG